MQRGIATFTLDYGKCPPWLFERMVKLGREMTQVLIAEYGPDEFIKRIANPVWFQSLGTVLAFDWNASGLTTILTAALKESIRGQEKELGIFICGGKGKTSRKTPDEIADWSGKINLQPATSNSLIYNSRMSAKVDSSLLQDGYQIYHHSFFFSKNGSWAVVQQGMNTDNQTARRYHWFSDDVEDLVEEPHSGIASQLILPQTLDLTSSKSHKNRDISIELLDSGLSQITHDLEILSAHSSDLSQMLRLRLNGEETTLLKLSDQDFSTHPVLKENFADSKYLKKILAKLCEVKPETYEQFLSMEGVGPKTVRALSLVSEVIYGAKPSYEDPARYSFAHGGKDEIPYPVDRKTYDQTINILQDAVLKSKIDPLEKDKALRRLTQNSDHSTH